jgi:hypothetical protein
VTKTRTLVDYSNDNPVYQQYLFSLQQWQFYHNRCQQLQSEVYLLREKSRTHQEEEEEEELTNQNPVITIIDSDTENDTEPESVTEEEEEEEESNSCSIVKILIEHYKDVLNASEKTWFRLKNKHSKYVFDF